jgi:hypothetical protein
MHLLKELVDTRTGHVVRAAVGEQAAWRGS